MITRPIAAAILCSVLALSGFSQSLHREVSVPEYLSVLEQAGFAVESCPPSREALRRVFHGLPQQWILRIGDARYTIQSEWLKAGLLDISENGSEEACGSARARIAALKADIQALQQPAQNFASDRAALSRILARREFRGIHGQTAWDRLKQKLMQFLIRLLGGILGSSAFPEISRIVIWMLLGLAILVLAIWTYRTLRRNAGLEAMELSDSAPVSAKPWNAWMADAHAAAAQERWRDAVHLSYWAGISFLESNGLWRPDRARTPREYLRLLPSSSEHRDSLSSLTLFSEAIWYGCAEAGPESFSQSLKYLERMGCHSN